MQGKVLFGYTNSKISWSKENKRWDLVNELKSQTLVAYLPSDKPELPIGTHKWRFVENRSCAGASLIKINRLAVDKVKL